MKVMSINARNSSIHFTLYEMDPESVLAEGVFDRIGMDGSNTLIKYRNNRITQEIALESYQDAVRLLLEKLIDLRILSSLDEIRGVGHRIVQGIDHYQSSMIVTDELLQELEEMKDFAPLHTSGELKCVKAFREALGETPMVLVFDSAFHQTMIPSTYLYPVPYEWYEKYGVRKYGFHGTSHRYIAEYVSEILGRDSFKLISCHLGEGASICAIRDMKCVDTSMGFTPLSGIMMNTRSGDVDPSIIPYVMEKEGKNASEVVDDLNKVSGLLGISEYSNSMNDILARSDEGDEKALLAKEMYIQRIVDYIAKYYVLLGGVNALAFTADIGENCVPIRREICERLACLGVKIDLDQNNIKGEFVNISTNDSSFDVFVIPNHEELMIARDTYNLINR